MLVKNESSNRSKGRKSISDAKKNRLHLESHRGGAELFKGGGLAIMPKMGNTEQKALAPRSLADIWEDLF